MKRLDEVDILILNFLKEGERPKSNREIVEGLFPTGIFKGRKDPRNMIRTRLWRLRFLPELKVEKRGGENYYSYSGPILEWEGEQREGEAIKRRALPPLLNAKPREREISNQKELEKGFKRSPPPQREEELYPLLQQFLFSNFKIYSKILNHRKGKKRTPQNGNQRWLYPDLIGVQFPELENRPVRELLRRLEGKSFANFYSFEVKGEIKKDWNLKKSYFQALSNSGWANYSFLVVYEIASELIGEVERLAQRFKVGLISLSQLKILVPSSYRELDYWSLDTLCGKSPDASHFIQLVDRYIEADWEYQTGALRELEEFCEILPPN